ncbi:hypothetical protein MHF_1456 [Mycoplasma haemofelis Ohio2]|uniref:Lipoprotein n=1 Tax=Mycoplasma haemofelis (strain Ohio2) TaxID=859194 RepID=F6FGY1_MYCHI|nr:hypothetical protein MHF_1456 [Mycoplasma haemofelis Ohio2]
MDVKLLSIPVALTGGACCTHLGYKYLADKSIKSRLDGFLLGFDKSFNSKWEERATLVNSKDSLPAYLGRLKDSRNGNKISAIRLKKWCQEQSKMDFVSEKDSVFLNVRNYCTFNNKDKLRGRVISEELQDNQSIKSGGQWSKANDKLKKIEDRRLSPQMKKIKSKLSSVQTNQKDEKALRTWCEWIYKKPWIGNQSGDFGDAQKYCVESVQARTR